MRARAEGRPVAELHAELTACDPATAARLRPSDPQRILRALEVFAATGQSLSSFQRLKQAPFLDAERCLAVFLSPDRDELRGAIAQRFDIMLEAGALDEVEALRQRGLDPALPVMRAHGVPHLIAYLEGRIDRAEAAARGVSDTRHYAKRQLTFARHQLPNFRWLSPACAEADMIQIIDGLPVLL